MSAEYSQQGAVMPDFEFVPTDGFGRTDPSDLSRIRRRGMLGKNKQPESRRSKREAARAAVGVLTRPDHEQISEVQAQLEQPVPLASRLHPRTNHEEHPNDASNRRNLVPRPPPSDWALFQFPGELDILSQRMMHKYFIRNLIRDAISPFELFHIDIDFGMAQSGCFRWLCFQNLSFHATVLMSAACENLVLKSSLSEAASSHLSTTLKLLNVRLSERDAYQDDVILYAVSTLSSVAILFGDDAAAANHAEGLRLMIRLRGGIRAFGDNPLVQFSLDRMNFLHSLVSNQWTSLYDASPSYRSFSWPDLHDTECVQKPLCIGDIDPELEAIFHCLQRIAALFNKYTPGQTPISGKVLQQSMGFIHGGLLKLAGRLTDDFSECLRLGIEVFIATTFRLPGMEVQYDCRALAHRLRKSYIAAKAGSSLHVAMDTWLMIFPVMLLVGTAEQDELGIHKHWEAIAKPGLSWEDTRTNLKDIVWIDAVHDDLGRKAFKVLMKLSLRQRRNSQE